MSMSNIGTARAQLAEVAGRVQHAQCDQWTGSAAQAYEAWRVATWARLRHLGPRVEALGPIVAELETLGWGTGR